MSQRIYKSMQRLSYEQLPIGSCCLQAIVHIVQFSLYDNNQMTIVGVFIQLVTFAFVDQSLSHLYYRVKYQNTQQGIKKNQILLIVKGVIYVIVIASQVYLMTIYSEEGCDATYYYSIILLELQMFVTASFATYFGLKLIRVIKRKQLCLNETDQSDENSKEKRDQIKQVIIILLLTVISQIAIINGIHYTNSRVLCSEETHEITDTIIHGLFTLLQQIPSFYIPYIFYGREHQNKSTTVFSFSPEGSTFETKEENIDSLYVHLTLKE